MLKKHAMGYSIKYKEYKYTYNFMGNIFLTCQNSERNINIINQSIYEIDTYLST